MADSLPAPPRHRPPPLPLRSHSPRRTPSGDGLPSPQPPRSALLNSLRTARPNNTQPNHQHHPSNGSNRDQQVQYSAYAQQQQNAVVAAAQAQAQAQAQYNYLALQNQILFQQSQILLQQQQAQQFQAQQVQAQQHHVRRSSGPFGAERDERRRSSGGYGGLGHGASGPAGGGFQAEERQRRASSGVVERTQAQEQRRSSAPFVVNGGAAGGGLLNPDEIDEASVAGNPLAASALARRKRQSLTLDPTATSTSLASFGAGGPISAVPSSSSSSVNPNRRLSYNPPTASRAPAAHHRRTSSSLSSLSISSSNPTSGSQLHKSFSAEGTPSLILSKPGDAFPDTSTNGSASVRSGSEGLPSPPLGKEDEGQPQAQSKKKTNARRYSVSLQRNPSASSSNADADGANGSAKGDGEGNQQAEDTRIAPWLEGIKEAASPSPPLSTPPLSTPPLSSNATSPSQEGSRRASQVESLTAALNLGRRRPASIGNASGVSGPGVGGVGADAGRSVSESYALANAGAASGLSPFATTFQPLPASPNPFTPTFAMFNTGYPAMPTATNGFYTSQQGGFVPQQQQHQQNYGYAQAQGGYPQHQFQPQSQAPPPPHRSTPPLPLSSRTGAAIPIRMPRGPSAAVGEAGLKEVNFRSRIRRGAVERLLELGSGRRV
ncbi:hypothetical protein MNV49_003891 [Pseudohyphozyma bogoriensis]|nr:hypothetical protein MNV49_003891 [Pseudohyphozyma bogoriensis]